MSLLVELLLLSISLGEVEEDEDDDEEDDDDDDDDDEEAATELPNRPLAFISTL